MRVKTKLPYTAMMERYHEIERKSRAQRLTIAKELATDPSPLIGDFLSSVQQWALNYSNVKTPFVPKPRASLELSPEESIKNTNALVARLQRPKRPIEVVDKSKLSFRYVEREVSIVRTANAEFRSKEPLQRKRSAGRALLCDLLLRNAHDRTPIVGEIKVTHKQYTDKDPCSALVQALASAAHLVTPSQYERLLWHYPRQFRTDSRVVDIYVVTGSYNSELTDMRELLAAARAIGRSVVASGELRPYVRRIEFVDVTPAGRGVTVRTRFR